jgi:hypothetical protein
MHIIPGERDFILLVLNGCWQLLPYSGGEVRWHIGDEQSHNEQSHNVQSQTLDDLSVPHLAELLLDCSRLCLTLL